MKKNVCLSALVCALAVTADPVIAQSTVTGGYAQSDYQGVANKANGFNLKFRYENGTDPMGWVSSFTYTEKDRTDSDNYIKGQYYGVTGGPAYRLNDWTSIYGVVGIGYGKYQYNEPNRDKNDSSDVGFSYGAGLQFDLVHNVALDVGYEQSRIRSIDIGTWVAGVGYKF